MGNAAPQRAILTLEEQAASSIRIFQPAETRLVVLVPALNERPTIQNVVERIPRAITGVDRVNIVVIDDGSTDDTGSIAASAGAVIVRHPHPSGVGAAFQSGLRKAIEMGADWIVSVDGDGQFAPEDIPKLLAPVLNGEADFATASRFKDPRLVPHMPAMKRWGNQVVSRLVSWLTGARYYDVSCGMRAYNRTAALNLSLLEQFTYTHEVFLHLSAKRMKITEVPIVVRGQREFGTSRVARSLLRYGLNTLRIVFRFYRDYYPLRFFGRIGAMCLSVGVMLLGFLVYHYARTQSFSPHKWAGFSGGGFCLLGCASLFMALVGDMLNRQRVYLEELLYHTRTLVSSDSRRVP